MSPQMATVLGIIGVFILVTVIGVIALYTICVCNKKKENDDATSSPQISDRDMSPNPTTTLEDEIPEVMSVSLMSNGFPFSFSKKKLYKILAQGSDSNGTAIDRIFPSLLADLTGNINASLSSM